MFNTVLLVVTFIDGQKAHKEHVVLETVTQRNGYSNGIVLHHLVFVTDGLKGRMSLQCKYPGERYGDNKLPTHLDVMFGFVGYS